MQSYKTKKIKLCLTGSGAKPVSSILKVPFVQEVAANAIALQDQFQQVGTAIELGGQDAKMIFLKIPKMDSHRVLQICE
ncbi:MAG: hypothetical protein ACLUTO_03280 [Anaerostipes sp.]